MTLIEAIGDLRDWTRDRRALRHPRPVEELLRLYSAGMKPDMIGYCGHDLSAVERGAASCLQNADSASEALEIHHSWVARDFNPPDRRVRRTGQLLEIYARQEQQSTEPAAA
jgi:hypothetical protein